MKVLVDHQIFLRQRVGGISRYHAAINNYINDSQKERVSFITAVGTNNIYLPLRQRIAGKFNVKGVRRYFYRINEQLIKSNLKNFDLLHPTDYNPYFLTYKRTTPFVITIHDLIPEQLFPLREKKLLENKRLLIEKASAVIAISNSTRNDIISYYKTDPDKIKVIYHGYPEIFVKKDLSEPQKKSILFLGNRNFYKNFLFFLTSVSSYMRQSSLPLKIIGKPLSGEETALVSELGLGSLITVITEVGDEDLFNHYCTSSCFVFPSLAEGFGLPILESFAAGCPLVCSDIPVFREVAEDAALYFQPDAPDELVMAIDKVLNDPAASKDLIERGYKRLQFFSWERSAKMTLDVYKSIL